MDVALAQSILSSRTAAAYQDAQVSMLRKTMDAEKQAAGRLIDSMMASMPLATEGSLGRHVNTYA
ncbi:putative motility protein [Mobilicoccus sp.]|uniref:putative motility protein n=1 Tax=Mobilicoccus sp. TaxID=2034349 RepID=UPI002899380E|nr:putative motility protein [Mobilicoccus sp.]